MPVRIVPADKEAVMVLHCSAIVLFWLAFPLFLLVFGCVSLSTRTVQGPVGQRTTCVAVTLALVLIVALELDLRRPEQSFILHQVPHALICG